MIVSREHILLDLPHVVAFIDAAWVIHKQSWTCHAIHTSWTRDTICLLYTIQSVCSILIKYFPLTSKIDVNLLPAVIHFTTLETYTNCPPLDPIVPTVLKAAEQFS